MILKNKTTMPPINKEYFSESDMFLNVNKRRKDKGKLFF